MGDMIADGLSWQIDQLLANCGQPVVYRRGATTANLRAVVEQTAFRTEDLGTRKSKLEWSEADFVFKSADLVNAGISSPPAQGDTIDFTPPGTGVPATYGLYHPPGEKPFKFDGYKIKVRIHTKAK